MVGKLGLAEQVLRKSLAAFRAVDDELGVGIVLHRLATSAINLGEPARARTPLEKSLTIFRRHGFRKGELQAIGSLGDLARMQGDAGQAVTLLEQSATMAAEEGFTWWEANTRANLAELALAQNQPEEATTCARQTLRLSRRIGDRQLTVYALAYLACAAAESGDAHRAGRLWGAVEAEEARRPLGHWEGAREQYAARVLERRASELESGLREGRQLPLPSAVDEALADGIP
jgi:non-specific serine/threonine protein kinase